MALRFAADAVEARGDDFLPTFLSFLRRVARAGVDNSRAQIVLKLTAPGIPDTFQGRELWDLSLVDPDNRRPVNYAVRASMLETMAPSLSGGQSGSLFPDLMSCWRDGRIKLATIALLLNFRRVQPALFAQGDYLPIPMTGEQADYAIGFARSHRGKRLIVLAALRPALRAANLGWRAFAGTAAEAAFNLISGEPFDPRRAVAEACGELPFALFWSDAGEA